MFCFGGSCTSVVPLTTPLSVFMWSKSYHLPVQKLEYVQQFRILLARGYQIRKVNFPCFRRHAQILSWLVIVSSYEVTVQL